MSDLPVRRIARAIEMLAIRLAIGLALVSLLLVWFPPVFSGRIGYFFSGLFVCLILFGVVPIILISEVLLRRFNLFWALLVGVVLILIIIRTSDQMENYLRDIPLAISGQYSYVEGNPVKIDKIGNSKSMPHGGKSFVINNLRFSLANEEGGDKIKEGNIYRVTYLPHSLFLIKMETIR